MKALVFTDISKMEYKEVPDPVLDCNHNVRVRIEACGICGSDVQGYLGRTGRRIPPMIMGHEMAGFITELGMEASSSGLAVGDRVVILPFVNCGECSFCHKGYTNFCISPKEYYGILEDNGGMCDEITINASQLVSIPSSVNPIFAALSEPMAVAYSAAKKISCTSDEPVLLFGAGTIGLMVLMSLTANGFKNIIVSDANPRRLQKALELGAKDVLMPERLKEYTSANGRFLHTIDAVGVPSTYKASIDSTENSGEIVWVGNACRTFDLSIPDLIMRGLTIKGSFIYTEKEIKEAIGIIVKNPERFSVLVELIATMDKGEDVFHRLAVDKEDIIKAVLINK